MKSTFALDLGTSKVAVSGMIRDPGAQEYSLKVVAVSSEGMESGVITSVQSLKNTIFEAASEFEAKYEAQIRKVSVGLTGKTLKLVERSVEFFLKSRPLDDAKLEELTREVLDKFSGSDLTPLMVWPKHFELDQRDAVRDPRGMSADKGTGYYVVVVADSGYVSDVMRACNEAGLQVEGVYPESIASALVTSSAEEREIGVCILDIGHGSCDGVVFKQGLPVHVFSLPSAGLGFSLAIAQSLGVSISEAEKLKIFFGMNPSHMEDERRISVKNITGQFFNPNPVDIRTSLMAQSRSLCVRFVGEVKDHKTKFPAGVILTGGGAALSGIVEHWMALLKIPVCLRVPSVVEYTAYSRDRRGEGDGVIKDDFKRSIQSSLKDKPHLSTAAGLLYLHHEVSLIRNRLTSSAEKIPVAKKMWHHVANWIRELS